MNNEQTITLTDEQQNLLNLILQNDEIIFFITEKSKVLAMEINDPKSSWDENAIHKFVMNLCPNNKTPGTTSCNYAGGKTLTFNCTKDNNAVIDLILKNAESMQGDKIGISETYCATNDQLNVLDLFGKMNALRKLYQIAQSNINLFGSQVPKNNGLLEAGFPEVTEMKLNDMKCIKDNTHDNQRDRTF